MINRKAFTLLEVLISIALMGIVLVALFSSVDILQDSNQHLFKQLEKTKKVTQSSQVLYRDILSSDGNMTITKDEFTRLCMESTANTLYALPRAKVCWVVLKEQNSLVRVEGIGYTLPTKSEDRVEVDSVMQNVELFDVYHNKDKVLVILKEKSKKAIKFMLQGISTPEPRKKDANSTKNSNSDPITPEKATNTTTDPVTTPTGMITTY
ncbi:prepilin-type N-terminal cleavage/methylation domain-containing protein [Sulfurovum sp.]|uniref:PulJ/GspJ family protein n=1 Tax=Sulfurovum sp. TaxID=1969726 RepID=UPI002867F9BB|nr:prepilin-type N-terminal cleavage/methylation domain-containing protein [Sulfurovum sp.]